MLHKRRANKVDASQGRKSPYVLPRNSPLAGALGLMTQDMEGFEYFPDTPSIAHDESPNASSTTDYLQNCGRNYSGPATYSSGHSSATYNTQLTTPNAAIEGSFRQAPVLSMNGLRYVRDGRPPLSGRSGTNASGGASVTYNRGSESGNVTFYPQHSRSQRSSSSATQIHHTREEVVAIPTVAELSVPDERSMSPSVLPLSEQELSAVAVTGQSPLTVDSKTICSEMMEPSKPQSPQSGRPRRETLSPRLGQPQRPGMTRTLTSSKLNLVSPAASAHSSNNSVPQLEQIVVKQKPESLNIQQSTFGLGGLLEGVVPPIVVLIVEDNMINQRILETFMKKRKIRCLTAKNGREAVDRWKQGDVHLVLMDIQMPVMSGIEAAKEIRRLERTNSIGVFSRKELADSPVDKADILTDMHFKSPVIIVALTASSLQSDRHEALAAGCNDFLTKPVSLVWLEKKVLEWGCMQALIDVEGWRKFRGLKEAVK